MTCCIVVRDLSAAGCGVPLEPTRTAFVVSVSVGEHGPYRFLFDTGTSTSVITPKLARRVGATMFGTTEAITTTGTVRVGRSVIENVRIGAIRRPALPVLILALPEFPSHGRIDGIIGSDILAGHGYRIDVDGRCLHFDAQAVEGSRVEAEEIGGRMTLRVG